MRDDVQFFWMREADLYETATTVAMAPEGYDSFEDQKISGYKREISTFKTLNEVPCVFSVTEGTICDYLPNNIDYPFFSPKLKELIDDKVKIKLYRWLTVKIRDERTDEQLMYYMPLFEQLVDTINYEKSRYLDEEKTDLVVPCFALAKIKDLDFFPIHRITDEKDLGDKIPGYKVPFFVDNHLMVSKRIRNAVRKQRLTGIRFGRFGFFSDT